MMFFLFTACSGVEYVLPQAEVFHLAESWEGTLSFTSYDGEKEQCSMYYSMEGEERNCVDCIWEVGFHLSALSESCVYPDLKVLSFRLGNELEWLVNEESGWEEWGFATEEEEGTWSFVSGHRFLP
jgi:hypothetical protein